jgi:FkbM family methyltransferase
MAEGWYDGNWEELPEIAVLRRGRLTTGARVFDLGAHQCVVALMLAKIVGPYGRVVALEANSHNAAIARRNRHLNNTPQLEVVEAAVAEKSGALYFNRALNGCVDDGTGDWGRQEVKAISVDDLTALYRVPDLLFVDVEGFEVKVLQGAKETLRHRPDCFIEVHTGCGLERYGDSVSSIFSFFPHGQFRVLVATEDEGEFRFLENVSDAPTKRFFLIALANRDGKTTVSGA